MRLSYAVLAFGLVVGSTSTTFAIEPGAPDRLLTYDDVIAEQLKQDLDALPAKEGDETNAAIRTFYADRNYRPVWINNTGFRTSAKLLMAEIARADDYGLEADKFEIPATEEDKAATKSVAKLSTDELALTQALLKYAVHARGGRVDPRSLSEFLDRGAYLVPPAKVLAAATSTPEPDAYLRSLHPQHKEFERLRQRYLALRRQGEQKQQIRIPNGRKLLKGRRHPHIALLRERLGVPLPKIEETAATDDTEDADKTDVDPQKLAETFDEALDEAVRAFQKKKGLLVDGIVGPGTRKALNGDGVDQTKRLLVNMERWRWMPPDLGNFYVWANIPDYKFYVVKDGEIIHSERVVVGKYRNQTATFSDEMEEIVFNPRWNVPNSIKQNELLPGLLRSPNALARQGLRVKYRGRNIDPASVDWATTDIRKYHIYQPSGPRNALGRIKFLFPNKHAIYMHDTPSKSLFNRSRRAFSHGCVRVRNPQRFAEVILAHDQGISPAAIRSRIRQGSRNSIFLKNKLPVHITYFTARADEEESGIRFLNDIYKHDKRIGLALDGKPPAYVSARTYRKPFKPRKIARKKKKSPFWAQNLFGWN